jgi:hypothetical protein
LPADLALKLSAAARVVIDIVMRGAAERAGGICRNVTGFAFLGFDRFYGFAIAEEVVSVPELPVLFDEWFDDRKFIREELLVFRAVEFIVSPLLKRNVSANKKNEPANLLILFLNDFK